MTTHERAKAYENVCQKVKDFFEGKQKMYNDVKQTLEYLFPELAESEDERMLRNFKSYLQEEIECYTYDCRDEEDRQKLKMFKYILTWLEKQDPKKHEEELKESEDELIRKEILDYIDKATGCKRWVAWLEKQGEPQPYRGNTDTMRKNLIKAFKSVGSKHWGGFDVRDIIHFLESKDAIELEKQGKQKPVDKIEPKFKVGDWVVYETEEWREVLQIETIESERYTFTNGSSSSFAEEQNMCLWTIEDAKAGDVLYCKGDDIEYIVMSKSINKHGNIDSYFRYNSLNGFGVDIPSVLSTRQDNITPATKEQRDLLLSKMKEAGYEWDSDKKELRKIDDYCEEHCKGFQETGKCFADGKCKAKRDSEQNPAWSEDDELMLTSTVNTLKLTNGAAQMKIDWLKSLKNRVQPQQKQEWSEEDEKYINDILAILGGGRGYRSNRQIEEWLKSLKPQSHWKPTQEQMNALYQTSKNKYVMYNATLTLLYNDLKKL